MGQALNNNMAIRDIIYCDSIANPKVFDVSGKL